MAFVNNNREKSDTIRNNSGYTGSIQFNNVNNNIRCCHLLSGTSTETWWEERARVVH